MAKSVTRLDGGSGVNRLAGTPPAFWFNWIQVLLGAGWVHRGSGTGTSGTFQGPVGADNTNIQITNEGTGAGGIDRNNAWIVLEDPGGRRQFMLHRGTSTTQWRMYYSALDKFTGTGFGAVSATVPPSATDQQQMIGTGGSFTGASFATAGTYVHHCVAYDAPEGGSNVYPWFLFATANYTGAGGSFVFCDALKAGSYDALDADPCVVGPVQGAGGSAMFGIAGNGIGSQFYSGSSPYIGGWYRMDLSSEAFVGVSAGVANINIAGQYVWGNVGNLPNSGGAAPDPQDSSEPMREMIVARGAGMAGSNFTKGIPALMRWSMAGYRSFAARLFQESADAYLYVGAALLPWPANTPLALG